jgi:hypothetical protein
MHSGAGESARDRSNSQPWAACVAAVSENAVPRRDSYPLRVDKDGNILFPLGNGVAFLYSWRKNEAVKQTSEPQ